MSLMLAVSFAAFLQRFAHGTPLGFREGRKASMIRNLMRSEKLRAVSKGRLPGPAGASQSLKRSLRLVHDDTAKFE
jgi:hypothetical protein